MSTPPDSAWISDDHVEGLARRSVLTLGLGVTGLVMTGCDDDAPAGSGGTTEPPADADSVLVARVVTSLRSAAALANATGAAVPALAGPGRRLTRLHERHARELGDTGTTPSRTVKGGRARLQRRLGRTEQRLQQRLVDAALDAESGALAQLLASMAAAVAQQRAGLA